jgi:ABC-type phosphate transport system substrate-binding protein
MFLPKGNPHEDFTHTRRRRPRACSAARRLAQSRDTIQIAGSSTVLPFASIVAEEFGAAFPEFKTPVVGSGGTGGGLKQFCEGVGENTIDIANASRKIKDSEREAAPPMA